MEKETYELKEKMNEFTGKLLEEKPSIIIANKDEEFSDWVCYLFGGSIVKWRPLKKEEPNWFWRWMQYLFFGNRWVKEKW